MNGTLFDKTAHSGNFLWLSQWIGAFQQNFHSNFGYFGLKGD
jgi:hypothetical protein